MTVVIEQIIFNNLDLTDGDGVDIIPNGAIVKGQEITNNVSQAFEVSLSPEEIEGVHKAVNSLIQKCLIDDNSKK